LSAKAKVEKYQKELEKNYTNTEATVETLYRSLIDKLSHQKHALLSKLSHTYESENRRCQDTLRDLDSQVRKIVNFDYSHRTDLPSLRHAKEHNEMMKKSNLEFKEFIEKHPFANMYI
jgi:uncharacterized membrane-anchored protein YhcB (DUF1043 family)